MGRKSELVEANRQEQAEEIRGERVEEGLGKGRQNDAMSRIIPLRMGGRVDGSCARSRTGGGESWDS